MSQHDTKGTHCGVWLNTEPLLHNDIPPSLQPSPGSHTPLLADYILYHPDAGSLAATPDG